MADRVQQVAIPAPVAELVAAWNDRSADRFVAMYVNELTCDYGDEGRQAVAELLRRAEAVGAYERPVKLEFVS